MTTPSRSALRLPRIDATQIATYGVLFVCAALIIFPLLWSFLSALKPKEQVFRIPLELLPSEWQWQNFILPFQQRPFGTYFLNSIFAAAATILITSGRGELWRATAWRSSSIPCAESPFWRFSAR
jgi:alpha-1,4-digalacturonate transport system permease protein